MNQTTVIAPKPKLNEAEASQLLHDSYLAQIKSNVCGNCQCGAEWLELYEVWAHPIKTADSRYNVLRPTQRLIAGMPLVYIRTAEQQIPVCSECIDSYKVAEVTAVPMLSREQWADTLKRKYTPEPKPGTDPRRPEPRLDQL